jgi:hypothetical protein
VAALWKEAEGKVDGSVLQTGLVAGVRPGGANTSHTIAVELLSRLLRAVPAEGSQKDYITAAIDANALARSTVEGRRRALRYLRELYVLDPTEILFRALRDLWDQDLGAQPLIAGLSAYARDSVFHASAAGVLPVAPGDVVASADLTNAVVAIFPSAYNDSTAGKIGRNTGSSWTQTGHLSGKRKKVRRRVEATPASAAYALLLGYLQGKRGQAIYDTCWTAFLDTSPHDIASLADAAARRGYLELRSGGGAVEIGFRHLLRPGLKGQA